MRARCHKQSHHLPLGDNWSLVPHAVSDPLDFTQDLQPAPNEQFDVDLHPTVDVFNERESRDEHLLRPIDLVCHELQEGIIEAFVPRRLVPVDGQVLDFPRARLGPELARLAPREVLVAQPSAETLTAHAAFATAEASARLLRMALEILAEERAAAGG